MLTEIKRDREALKDYERFFAVCPQTRGDARYIEQAALLYQRAGQLRRSIELYSQLYRLNPCDAWLLKKAACYTQLNKFQEAMAAYSEVLARNHEDEIALLERGKLRAHIGLFEPALQDFNQAIKTAPTASVYRERAKVYEKLGKTEAAKQDRARAEKSNTGW